ncbi:MAG: hypothetical protein O2967_18630 [Proteobacteria bacterium]|nr:hypothetical protein [Pseudomonadota bacterium]
MNKMEEGLLSSPYLQLPLRSLDQALKDHADMAARHDKTRPKQPGPSLPSTFSKDKLAS